MATVYGFSGSPRSGANTDTLVSAVLEGAAAAGAETRLLRIQDMCKDLKITKTIIVPHASILSGYHDPPGETSETIRNRIVERWEAAP